MLRRTIKKQGILISLFLLFYGCQDFQVSALNPQLPVVENRNEDVENRNEDNDKETSENPEASSSETPSDGPPAASPSNTPQPVANGPAPKIDERPGTNYTPPIVGTTFNPAEDLPPCQEPFTEDENEPGLGRQSDGTPCLLPLPGFEWRISNPIPLQATRSRLLAISEVRKPEGFATIFADKSFAALGEIVKVTVDPFPLLEKGEALYDQALAECALKQCLASYPASACEPADPFDMPYFFSYEECRFVTPVPGSLLILTPDADSATPLSFEVKADVEGKISFDIVSGSLTGTFSIRAETAGKYSSTTVTVADPE